MSVKSRVKKLERQVIPMDKRRLITRRQFEERVDRLMLGLNKFGVVSTEALARRITAEQISKSPAFAGFDFDPMVD